MTGQIDGLDGLLKTLGMLRDQSAKRIQNSAAMAGANALKREIRTGAPDSMKDSIGARMQRGGGAAIVGVNVGRREGSGGYKRWAPLLVMGSKQRFRNRVGGKYSNIRNPTPSQLSTGRIDANQVVKNGLSSGRSAAQQAMANSARKALAREVANRK